MAKKNSILVKDAAGEAPASDPARAGAKAKGRVRAGARTQGKDSGKASAAPTCPKADITLEKPVRKRREQQRAIDTKRMILDAALSEFALVGFEAASIRNIAANTGLQHPLITYHYRTKEILWRAVAEDAFAEIRRLWDEGIADYEHMTPIERLRAEYSAFLRFTIAYPDFHHFMLRESRPGNPRLPWLVQTILQPTMQRILPEIEAAQAQGQLPPGNPALIHYMMIGMTSVLSSLKDEIKESSGLATDDPRTINSYLSIIDATVFHSAQPGGSEEGASKVRGKRRRAKSSPD